MDTDNDPVNPKITSGKHISFWVDDDTVPDSNPLKENKETDVVIVGGGLAGLSVAYCLAITGKKVIVVEDGFIGSGETGRTTAHIVTSLDDRYFRLEKVFGEAKTKLIAESHKMAIDFIEQVIERENIECDFKRVESFLFLHPSDNPESLQLESKAASKVGIEVKEAPVAPGLRQTERALCFLNQAQFHPLQYLRGLCKAIEKHDGEIYTVTHAATINHEGITTADGFTVKAKHVVVATNTPVNNLAGVVMKQVAYRTYVIGALVKKDLLPHALWADTGDFNQSNTAPPYHYARVQKYNDQYDLLICGGEDHPTGNDNDEPEETRYQKLEEWTRIYFPIEEDIVYRWSGQVQMPMDGLAFIGRNPFDADNVYIITGDAGNGMTHCTFAGLLITDLINGKINKWEKLYNPSRFILKRSGSVFKQMMHEFISYMKQMPNFKTTQELDSVKNGEGKIVDMLEEKFGVYRNENGQLHIVSAICTHMKCTLAWNSDEKSWDCPCHGSRFTYEGKVMNGPANTDLQAYSEVAEHLEKKEE